MTHDTLPDTYISAMCVSGTTCIAQPATHHIALRNIARCLCTRFPSETSVGSNLGHMIARVEPKTPS